jgi:hypothetical protein
MNMKKFCSGTETLPMGFHVVENSAPSVAEARLEKNLSRLAASLVASCSSATVPRADLRARLQSAAVKLYLARGLDNPSESMDDPVILLLEKAQSLTT